MSVEIPSTLKPFAHAIDEIEDYRSQGPGGDGYWVHLKPGWKDTNRAVHSFNEDGITAVAEEMRLWLAPCNCEECRKLAKKSGAPCSDSPVDDHVLALPARFYDDHSERALPAGDVIKQSTTMVTVRCDEPTLAEILDDAKHYAHRCGPCHEQIATAPPEEQGYWKALLRSAERTVALISEYRARERKE